MGLEHQGFSFFPFGALYCLTLFCFLAVRIFSIIYRSKDHKKQQQDISLTLKRRVASGEIDDAEYQRLSELLCK